MSVINSHIRQIKVVATNGHEQTAIVIKNTSNKESSKRYYETHKEQKKMYVAQNQDRIKQYHKDYYQANKEDLKRRHREYMKRKNNTTNATRNIVKSRLIHKE